MLDDIREIIESAYFTYIRQSEMKGLGHAILTGRELVGDEPFAVVQLKVISMRLTTVTKIYTLKMQKLN